MWDAEFHCFWMESLDTINAEKNMVALSNRQSTEFNNIIYIFEQIYKCICPKKVLNDFIRINNWTLLTHLKKLLKSALAHAVIKWVFVISLVCVWTEDYEYHACENETENRYLEVSKYSTRSSIINSVSTNSNKFWFYRYSQYWCQKWRYWNRTYQSRTTSNLKLFIYKSKSYCEEYILG